MTSVLQAAGAGRVHDLHRRLPRLHGTAAGRTGSTTRSPPRSPSWRRRWAASLGDPADPLLVSVRSGAKFSMPGMMDTVLNLGLNDKSVKGLAAVTGDERFAYDSLPPVHLDVRPHRARHRRRAASTHPLEKAKADGRRRRPTPRSPPSALKALCTTYKAVVKAETGKPFPQDPSKQLRGAVEAVFTSWNGARAIAYRVRERISHDLGTAVNVQAMVFGNRDDNSGTGVGFTRNAATGENKPYGDFLINAQGEDVVAGIRNTEDLDALETHFPAIHDELLDDLRPPRAPLPGHVRHRVHHRAGQALDAADPRRQAHRRRRAAHGRRHDQGHRQGRRTAGRSARDEALQRVTADHLDQVLHPQFAGTGKVHRQGPGRLARRRRRQGLLHRRRRRRRPPSGARRSSSCATRPAPRTSTA